MDAGKFYDEPELYISEFEFSRLAANKGKQYNQAFDADTELTREITDGRLLYWNIDAVDRIYGCDECNMGDLACSLGSARKYMRGECGYIDKKADYYGYNDIDEEKHADNPYFDRNDDQSDTKWDYESGIPDYAVSEKPIRTIKTNMSALATAM